MLLLDSVAVFDAIGYDLMTCHLVDTGIPETVSQWLISFLIIRDRAWHMGRGFLHVTL